MVAELTLYAPVGYGLRFAVRLFGCQRAVVRVASRLPDPISIPLSSAIRKRNTQRFWQIRFCRGVNSRMNRRLGNRNISSLHRLTRRNAAQSGSRSGQYSGPPLPDSLSSTPASTPRSLPRSAPQSDTQSDAHPAIRGVYVRVVPGSVTIRPSARPRPCPARAGCRGVRVLTPYGGISRRQPCRIGVSNAYQIFRTRLLTGSGTYKPYDPPWGVPPTGRLPPYRHGSDRLYGAVMRLYAGRLLGQPPT